MNLKTDILKKKFGRNLIINENLSKYSWFNLGGPADIFFRPENKDQLIKFLDEIRENNYKIYILGARLKHFDTRLWSKGIVIKLGSKFSDIKLLTNDTIEVGAAVLDRKVQILQKITILAAWNFVLYSRLYRRSNNNEQWVLWSRYF